METCCAGKNEILSQSFGLFVCLNKFTKMIASHSDGAGEGDGDGDGDGVLPQ